jgi:hypothetical protein
MKLSITDTKRHEVSVVSAKYVAKFTSLCEELYDILASHPYSSLSHDQKIRQRKQSDILTALESFSR